MIQRILRSRDFSISRLDGTITKNTERKRIVDTFQREGSDVFLLTTQVRTVFRDLLIMLLFGSL